MANCITKLDQVSDATLLKNRSIIYRIYLFFLRLFCHCFSPSHQEVSKLEIKVARQMATPMESALKDWKVISDNSLGWVENLTTVLFFKHKRLVDEIAQLRKLRDEAFDSSKFKSSICIDPQGIAHMMTEEDVEELCNTFLEEKEAYRESLKGCLAQQQRIGALYQKVKTLFHQMSPEKAARASAELKSPFQETPALRSLDSFVKKFFNVNYLPLYEQLEKAFKSGDFKQAFVFPTTVCRSGKQREAFTLPDLYTPEDLKCALKRAWLETHPDVNIGLSRELFDAFNYAYDQLRI